MGIETYIIIPKSTPEIDRLKDGGYRRKSPDEIRAFHVAKERAMQPICDYLNGLGLEKGRDYHPTRSFVISSLTFEQADEIRKRDDVKDVVADFGGFELIE